MKTIALAIVFASLFSGLSIAIMVEMPPWAAVPGSLALGWAFLAWHLRDDAVSEGRRAVVQLRTPQGSRRDMAVAIGATLAISLGIAGLIEMFAPPFTDEALEPFADQIEYMSSVGGWIAMVCLGGVVVPIVEEFCFRGYVQRTLQRGMPLWAAIAVTGLIFTVLHIGMPHWSMLLLPLTLAVGMGVAVHWFGSIWVGVITHSAWNTLMSVSGAVTGNQTSTFGGMDSVLLMPLAVVLIGAGTAGWFVLLRAREGRAQTPTPEPAAR